MELDQVKAEVAKLDEKVAKLACVQDLIKIKESAEKLKAGAIFVDIEAVSSDGSAVKLSDYVGKGKCFFG